MADDRPPVSRALDAVNDAFHESYDRKRALEERKGAVLVVLADELVVILRDGTRRTFPLTPRLFHVIKSVAHVPVALFAAMHRAPSEAPLKKLGGFIDDALASLVKEEQVPQDTEGADHETLPARRTLLQESKVFVERVLALDPHRTNEPGAAGELLASFAETSGKRLLHLTELATRVQLTAIHAVVEKALGELDEAELRHFEVVVTGNHQARARSLGMQYFRKRLGELGCLTSITNSPRVASRTDATRRPHPKSHSTQSSIHHCHACIGTRDVSCEDELPRCRPPPHLEAALERAELCVRKLARSFLLETEEQLASRSIGLLLKPHEHAWPDRLEGVLVRAPVPWRLRFRLMSRSHFAAVPRRRKTLQELVEIGIPMRVHARRLPGSDPRELVLNRPDLVEEAQWIERRGDGAQALLRCLRHGLRLEQAPARSLRYVVALRNSRADALLLGELERWLEEVHERP